MVVPGIQVVFNSWCAQTGSSTFTCGPLNENDPIPGGMLKGDMILVLEALRNSSGTTHPTLVDAGGQTWVETGEAKVGTMGSAEIIYTLISDPTTLSSVVLGHTGTNENQIAIFAYLRGVNPTQLDSSVAFTTSSATTAFTVAGKVTTVPGCLAVVGFTTGAANTYSSPTSGWTQIAYKGGPTTQSAIMFAKLMPDAGDSGTFNVTCSSSTPRGNFSLAIRPADVNLMQVPDPQPILAQ